MKPRKQHQMTVFKNRVLWRISGLRRGELTGGWRKLHNRIIDYCCLRDIINMLILRKMGWLRHVACMGKYRTAYRIVMEKPEGEKPLGRHGYMR
jgi:hypothetical protein